MRDPLWVPENGNTAEQGLRHLGMDGVLRQLANELEHLIETKQIYFPGVLAQVYAKLGDKDKAFYWPEDGAKNRHLAMADPVLVFVKSDPAFAPLRSDPRFKVLLQHMGLPE